MLTFCVVAANRFDAIKHVSARNIPAAFKREGKGVHFFECGSQWAEIIAAWYDESRWPLKDGDLCSYR